MLNTLNAISPIDGRYRDEVASMASFFSEAALLRYRLKIEIEYLIALSREPGVSELPEFDDATQKNLRELYASFSEDDAAEIKQIEATTRHDVKAVEYFLKDRLGRISIAINSEWIHFALTSEDVNNLSYSLMWQEAIQQVYLPELQMVTETLRQLAHQAADTALLALTHGQPATPTTLGKEITVFVARLVRQTELLKSHRL
ncbi:MAG TPA: adenylosuccinate lyase, partial [Candidatus Marinimicrobia bacterium]|nr:adenylosuccinate lyase [Candidatus Neomarinimicrobiota bacterium]